MWAMTGNTYMCIMVQRKQRALLRSKEFRRSRSYELCSSGSCRWRVVVVRLRSVTLMHDYPAGRTIRGLFTRQLGAIESVSRTSDSHWLACLLTLALPCMESFMASRPPLLLPLPRLSLSLLVAISHLLVSFRLVSIVLSISTVSSAVPYFLLEAAECQPAPHSASHGRSRIRPI